jgi:hypothetical protein
LFSAAIAVILVVGGRWYYYIAYASDPFDEVGIEINTNMPMTAKAYGCNLLKSRFEKVSIPPMGCGVEGHW